MKNNPHLLKLNDGVKDIVSIYGFEYSPNEAKQIAAQILALANNCNAAIIKPLRSLFETNKDPKYQTIEIDGKTLSDFQALGGESATLDFRQNIVDLIDFYASMDRELNIIILPDALEGRMSYTKFTAQLVQFIKAKQSHYSTIIVEYDPASSSLGIFCRHSPIHSAKKFLGSMRSALTESRSAVFNLDDVPASYRANPALIRFLAKKHMGIEVGVQVDQRNMFILKK